MAQAISSIVRDAQLEAVRVPPQSIEAEQSVLGGLLLDNASWDKIADIVVEADFYRADHRAIYTHIARLIEQNKPADALTVSESLERTGKLADVGGQAYIGALALNTPSAANIRRYAEIVQERSILRSLAAVGTEIADSAYTPTGKNTSLLVDEAEAKVFQIAEAHSKARQGFVKIDPLLTETVERIDTLYSRENKSDVIGLSTGFVDLDKMTAGLQQGELIIVAGRPSMGKTALVMNMAEHVALQEKKAVGVFSMEMSGPQLAMRMIGSVGRVNQHELRTGTFKEDEWPRLVDAVGKLNDGQIYIDDTAGLNVLELRSRARRLHRQCGGLSIVIVDYLQLMSGTGGREENRATEIAEISRSLKALAKELRVPVVALSQLNRSVDARQDKRPMMSDLRECVTGETLVLLADGRRVPIRDLVGTEPIIWAVGENGHVVPARSDKVWSVGVRPVFAVVLASGRRIRATALHRLYGASGWIRVADINVGDRVALARRLGEPLEKTRWRDEELILLGHLIGDGSYPVHQPLRYTTASEENSAVVADAAIRMGSTVTRHAGRGNRHQLVIAGTGNRWHPKGANAWLRSLGIFGHRSHEKHLPEIVFQLDNEQVALLLRHLWATDGCITVRRTGRGAPRVYFCTCSRRLAEDVAALLLRFGIVARLRVVHSGRAPPVHTVDVSGKEQQIRFLDQIGAFGPRVAPAVALRQALDGVRANTNIDTLPAEVFAQVKSTMPERGISQRAMTAMRGTSYGGTSHFRFSPSRATIADYPQRLGNAELAERASDDLFWDRVVGVEPAGEEEVFDLTVPGPASWLADGIVSHNSGAIEQDADVIMFIYREEVYNATPENTGKAELIVAKQRNGPVGKVPLTFLGKFTRFENSARDDRF